MQCFHPEKKKRLTTANSVMRHVEKQAGWNAALLSNTWCLVVVKSETVTPGFYPVSAKQSLSLSAILLSPLWRFLYWNTSWNRSNPDHSYWAFLCETRSYTNRILLQRVCLVILPRKSDAGHRFLRAEGSPRNHLRPRCIPRPGAERLCSTLWAGIRNPSRGNSGKTPG